MGSSKQTIDTYGHKIKAKRSRYFILRQDFCSSNLFYLQCLMSRKNETLAMKTQKKVKVNLWKKKKEEKPEKEKQDLENPLLRRKMQERERLDHRKVPKKRKNE